MLQLKTDEKLMSMYQSGSEEAFAVLYARHSKKIYGYLRSKVSSEQEAVDLMQETFVKIHKSKHLYNMSLPALPWIFSVTRSVLLDGYRKMKHKKEVYGVDVEQVPMEQKEESAFTIVEPMMEKLSKQQQVALRHRYVEEKTFEEIASVLNTSPMNVRQIISRGLKKLKAVSKKEKWL